GKPVSPPLEHQDSVASAAFSPDGTRVVTASYDRTARIWDAATGQPVSPPLQHQDPVADAAFSPDGTQIVTSGGPACVWDAVSGKPLSAPFQHRSGCDASPSFSPDGSLVVTIDGDAAQIWKMPRAAGTLAEWRAIASRASPFVLANGVLVRRGFPDP